MKKMIIILMLFVSVHAALQAQKYDFDNLAGSWRNSKGVGLDVVDSNTVYIVYGEKRTLANTSKTDFSQNPVWLDLSVKNEKQVVTLKSLLRFVNDHTLQWQLFDAETKPANYNGGRDMLYLKKVEQLTN